MRDAVKAMLNESLKTLCSANVDTPLGASRHGAAGGDVDDDLPSD